MQDRYLWCPPYFFLGPAVAPHFFILESPLLTSWKFLPLALWVRYCAEEGADQLNKIKFFATASTAHGCQNVLVKTKQII